MSFLNQTPIVAGQSSTATFIARDENGNLISFKFLVPPGKNAQLPDNLVTSDQMQGYLVGVLGAGATDQKGVDLHWNGYADTPQFVYGSLDNQKFSNLLGTNAAGLYLTNYGNVVPEMPAQNRVMIQSFSAKDVKDGDVITYPHPFANDDVQVFLTPQTPSTIQGTQWLPPLVGYANPNRYHFNMTRLYTDGTPKEWAGNISVVVIGGL